MTLSLHLEPPYDYVMALNFRKIYVFVTDRPNEAFVIMTKISIFVIENSTLIFRLSLYMSAS